MTTKTHSWALDASATPSGHWMDAWDDAMEAPAVVFDRALCVTWRSPRLSDVFDDTVEDALGQRFATAFPELADQEAALQAAFDGGPLPPGGAQWGFTVTFQLGPQGHEILALMRQPESDVGVKLSAAALSTLTHEMRTPLNAVVGMAELLSQSDLDRAQRRYVSVCRSAADNLLDLINNFLDLQKLSAGHLEIEEDAFYLPDVLDSVMEIMSVRAHQRGLELLTDIEADTPRYLVGDTYRLRQVLMNLVGNATKFTEFGHIRIHVKPAPGESLQFVVEDTGPGVEESQRARLFRPFWQLSAEAAKRNMGTGLGLSISRQLVERMGGGIWYEPRSDGESGARFCFTCELKRQNAPTRTTLSPHVTLATGAVLVVHPTEAVRDNLVGILRQWGVDAIGADGMAHFVRLFATHTSAHPRFSVVICDDMLLDTISTEITAHNVAVVKLVPPELAGRPHDDASAVVIKPVRRADLFESLNGLFGQTLNERRTTRTSLLLRRRQTANGHRVLVIDDSDDNRLIVESMLRAGGAEAEVYPNARSGLQALFENPRRYNLVLLDLMMPEVNGYDALSQIQDFTRANGAWSPPVLAFTASSDPADIHRCLNAGFAGHVSKPVTLAAIIAAVDGYAQMPPPRFESEVNEARMTLLRGDFVGISAFAERMIDLGASPSVCADLRDAATQKDRDAVTRALHLLASGPPVVTPSVQHEDAAPTIDDAIAELLPEFFDRRWADIAELTTALAGGDVTAFRNIGHQVAGTGATFGFPSLSDLGARMEKSAKANQSIDAFRPLLDEFVAIMRDANPSGEPPSS